MKRKTVSEIMLTLLLFNTLILAFNVPHVKADGFWVWVRNTVTGDYGEAIVGTVTALYVARGTGFYRYLPANNSWIALASPPKPDGYAFKTGTALAWDFGDYIYTLYGAATDDSRRWFYRYNIPLNSWEALANTTADQGEGDAMAWVGIDNDIYATIGGEQRPTYFVRYDSSTNSWSDAPADPPAGMGDGASLVWTGGNFLYALRGEFYESSPLYDFWQYDLTTDTWATMADIPAYNHSGGVGGVGDGGSLLYVGFWLSNQTDYIYALSGNQAYPETPVIPDNRTYRYIMSMNSWEYLPDLPFGVGYYVGCRLGYADGHIYAWQGAPSTWTGGGDDLARYEFAPSDSTSPATLHNYDGLWHTTDFTITLTATDDLSGVAEIYYKINDGPTKTVIADDQPLIITEGANNTLEYWSVDNAGNEESHHILTGIKLDKTAPAIGIPSQEPAGDVQPDQPVKVSVNVTDIISQVKNVTLYYTLNNRTIWEDPILVNLNFSTNLYETTIPGQPAGTWVRYKIVAYDFASNNATLDGTEPYCVYQVIPEFPSSLILIPLFITTTLIIVLIYRRKQPQ